MADQTQAVVAIDPADVEHARKAAAEHGVELYEITTTGFEPVTTVTLALLGAAAAVGTVLYLIERHKGGQVFDLRPDAKTPIYRDKNLAYGYVAIYRADGTITVEVKEPKGAFGIVVEAITGMLGNVAKAGIEEAGAAVGAAVGDNAKVAVGPAQPV
jgi:hypothetical protein